MTHKNWLKKTDIRIAVILLSYPFLGVTCNPLTGTEGALVSTATTKASNACNSSSNLIEQSDATCGADWFDYNEKRAQSFTVSSTVRVASIEIISSLDTVATPKVSLYKGGSTPDGGTLLASATTSPDGKSKTWHTFTFSSYPQLVAGTTYYIVITHASTAGGLIFPWHSNGNNPYTGGSFYSYIGSWGAAQPNNDLSFRLNICQ